MRAAGVFAWAFLTAAAASAEAFPGYFFLDRRDSKIPNSATTVVIARRGTRTVVSMQMDYTAPAETYDLDTVPLRPTYIVEQTGVEMIVPVPATFNPDAVKRLPSDIFERLDVSSAPRLVESWQQDPCTYADIASIAARDKEGGPSVLPDEGSTRPRAQETSRVQIDAQFAVRGASINVIEPSDLEPWLERREKHIPENVATVLRSYKEAGWKFFVTRFYPSHVEIRRGRSVSSPIQFEYDAEEVRLPLRLGLSSSAGTQDLVVHVLAEDRYEATNFPNLTIPTNVEVDGAARAHFGEFYASLFDATLDKNPGAFVTEYAWDAESCDPCPGPLLSPEDLRWLGAPSGMVVHTRLHARYRKEALGEDPVLRVAPPIQGGRGGEGQAAVPAEVSTFQGRYVLRHRWQGPVTCPSPDFDIWGGPPSADLTSVRPATPSSEVVRGKVYLSAMVRDSVPAAGVVAKPRPDEGSAGKRFLLGFGLGAGAGLFGTIGVVLAVTQRRRVSRRISP
ncbi:DUF2330 domain-containing protein [Polyangium mundeleinium]|uniref:DUF2330 domain-containing protein n=1 Tax=Polyangium mundeleinium TaxID=2995306 RepID=A0ABT5EJQ1_9BACT|nr:DUF2330 domain-containing protein [Polyangium mundeleinium]MDC0741177.1 DUF2330 domain-containing protein [Polyangium mundeleinium]